MIVSGAARALEEDAFHGILRQSAKTKRPEAFFAGPPSRHNCEDFLILAEQRHAVKQSAEIRGAPGAVLSRGRRIAMAFASATFAALQIVPGSGSGLIQKN